MLAIPAPDKGPQGGPQGHLIAPTWPPTGLIWYECSRNGPGRPDVGFTQRENDPIGAVVGFTKGKPTTVAQLLVLPREYPQPSQAGEAN